MLLFSFCGDSSEIFSNRLAVRDSQTALKVNEIVLTTTQKIINSTTTTSTTIYDWEAHYLRLDNFKKAWEKTLKEPITLTKEEMDLTDYFYSLWIWKGDKWTPENENFYEIKVNGQICKRIWNRANQGVVRVCPFFALFSCFVSARKDYFLLRVL